MRGAKPVSNKTSADSTKSAITQEFPRYVCDGISQLVFLDRYAIKDSNKCIKIGDTVVVLTKDDPKYPQKDVGIVKEIDGDQVTVELQTTKELFVQEAKKMDRCLETSPSDMWDRMAKAIVEIEPKEKRKSLINEFRWLLDDFRFSPGGRINAMLGTGQQLTAYNCYVLPVKTNGSDFNRDSRQAIIDTLGNMVEIMSRGGGVGINLSTLRPRLSYVSGVNGRSSGAVSWGGLFSFATGLVEQGGSRRGALMLVLEDWHPDLCEFIQAKRDMSALPNANISVGISEAFMQAVEQDAQWDLIFPDTSDPDYDRLWDGNIKRWRNTYNKPIKVYKTMPAREIWNTLIQSAWASAEPGVVFLERMNQYSNSWYFEDLVSTNPCGEQPLPGWGVCNLGHINLSRFAVGPIGHSEVNWEDLKRTIHGGVRFLDNIIDITPYFFEENEKIQKAERRIGLGTLGLGEMLIRLGIPYGNDQCVEFIDRLYQFIATEAYLASIDLAKERGSFPKFEAEKYVKSKYIQGLPAEVIAAIEAHGIRNVCLLTQAPTGSTGTMIGTSTGIEPFYSWTYWRNSRLGMREVQERIVQAYFQENPDVEPDIMNLPDYFITAMQLTPEEHIKVQGAIQRWTDSSISKTANVPNSYTMEQTKQLYEYAYKLGCKGVTIYRDGSRDTQVLSTKPEKEEEKPAPSNGNLLASSEMKTPMRKRPPKLTGSTYEWSTPLGKVFITVNEYKSEPVEVFVTIGKAGSDVAAMSEALGRLTTIFLKYADLDIEEKVETLVKHLKDIGGSSSVGFGQSRVSSVPDAIAKTLKTNVEEKNDKLFTIEIKGLDLCPSCGQATLRKEEGCANCISCGYSKC
jgi:ribonucleoside-diphosphate reductase alpha chain